MKVEKKRFQLPELTLENGAHLRDVEVGYETYGQLNDAGTNAILIAHFFSGTSHAAGRYEESDPEPGYWNSIIGPGKAIDTDKYFVVSSDTLCNLNVHSPNVITTGPASINPDTGKPYGSSFPVVTIGDFVRVQKALVDSLGVKHLYAVAGPSMGSLQALEWTASYPEFVDRAICVISASLESPAYLIATINTWCTPIYLDPHFRGGDYYDLEKPMAGLVSALKLVLINALHYGNLNRLFGRRLLDSSRSPIASLDNHWSIESYLHATALESAQTKDANSLLRLARASQAFSVKERKDRIRAQFLFLPAKSDLLMFPAYAHAAAEELRNLGLNVQLFELEGEGGHLDGINEISQASGTIRRFLET